MQVNDIVASENNTYKIAEMFGAANSDRTWVRLVCPDFISPEVLGDDTCTAVRQSKWVSASVVRNMDALGVSA